jgi:hypothetical protein
MFSKLLLTDTSGKKSATLTSFVVGFLVVNAKLILSGVTIGDFTITPFSGGEYAAALTALGGIYVLRRSTDPKKEENK